MFWVPAPFPETPLISTCGNTGIYPIPQQGTRGEGAGSTGTRKIKLMYVEFFGSQGAAGNPGIEILIFQKYFGIWGHNGLV